MKKKILKWTALCITAVFLIAAAAVPALAASMSEEDAEYLLENTKQFVAQMMVLDEETLAETSKQEGFYGIAAKAVLDTKDDIGVFQEVKDGSISQDGSNVTILVDIACEKYDAQVEITYNWTENAPKNFVINPDYPLSVNMANAGRNTIIGLVIVFAVLVFLSFVISLFKHIGGGHKSKKKQTDSEEPVVMPVAEDDSKAVPTAAAVSIPAGEEEIIAVIAAAIAAAEEENGTDGTGYFVRSIRKIGSSKRWKRA